MHSLGAALKLLAQLRWLGLAGYSLAFLFAGLVFRLPIRFDLAAIVLASLLAFAVYAQLRAREGRAVSPWDVLAHVALDILALTVLLFLSGGIANPFVSLYLLPIALLAFTLPVAQVWLVAALCALGYGILWWAPTLPHPHHSAAQMIDLHLAGMWLNFLLSALLMTLFATRIARVMAEQRAAAARQRESALREEGVLAVASQAAATVHELNTPLSSVAVVVGELQRALGDRHEWAADLAAAEQQLGVCREVLRRLGLRAQEPDAPATLPSVLQAAADRVRLLRGATAATITVAGHAPQLHLRQAARIESMLINLLGNALDASAAAGRAGAELRAYQDQASLCFEVIDRGAGWQQPPRDFASDKADGMGLGLTLVRLIVEQFGGDLSLSSTATGGQVRVRLPLATVQVERCASC